MAFTSSEESCSPELEKVGRKIAENCEGLPLAIISIAELLSKSEKTLEYWTNVSEDENPLLIGVDNTTVIAKAVLWSYEMMNYKLQVFFLHLGVFPRHYEIFVANLIKLWITEGFYRQKEGRSPESVAELCFFRLNRKGVILSSETSSHNNNVKKCRDHTVFRNLCIHMAKNSKFSYVMKKFAYSFPHGTNKQHRLCIHNNIMLALKDVQNTMESIPRVRSLLCFGEQHGYPLRVHLSFRLLRALDALLIRFYEFPDQVLNLIRLKYFTFTDHGQLPRSISRLQNLQVLIIGRYHRIKSSNAPSYLPEDIWSLKSLRHLKCIGTDLPNPCTGNNGNNYDFVLEHLLTLSGVSARSCTPGILKRMPNLKKLGIQIELAPDEDQTFSFINDVAEHLHYLEKFTCVVLGLRSDVVSTVPKFPKTLKKLTLSGCGFFLEGYSTD